MVEGTLRQMTLVAVCAVGLTATLRGQVTAAGEEYATIELAIAAAPAGGHVVVGPGRHTIRQPIVIDKPLVVSGDSGAVIEGRGDHELIVVTADSVALLGLELRNVATSFVQDRAAIRFQEVVGCRVERVVLRDTFFGIYLAKSDGCVLRDNFVTGSKETETRSGNAIHLWYSRNVMVEGNVLSGHRDGIYFEFVEDATVRDNISVRNLRYGLHFMFSDRCRYHGNVFQENGAGVAVMYTSGVTMTDNRFLDNWGSAAFGLLLKEITDSRIEGNIFQGNTVAVYAEGSNRIEVSGNDFLANGWAVKLMANSVDNNFIANNFEGNTFDVATNSRQSTSSFRGNYWDRYRGYDLDRDGSGDVPFRPVSLFSYLVQRHQSALILMRSAFVDLLNLAERIAPVLTPEALRDDEPLMARRTS